MNHAHNELQPIFDAGDEQHFKFIGAGGSGRVK